jgi:protein-disulfide isomerase
MVLGGVVVSMAGSTANIHGNAFGDPRAPVTIEVFSDFQCPACKGFHDSAFQRIMTDYVVPGKVYVVYRYFPLAMHPYGRLCAEYACAAARVERYQKVAEALFAQQTAIAASGKVEEAADSVLTQTEAKTVKSLLKAPEVQHEIDADMDEGKLVPVAATPTLWVTRAGRSQAVSSNVNYALLKSYLDGLLAK